MCGRGVVCVFECSIFYLSQNTSQNHPLSGRKRNKTHRRINDVLGVGATHNFIHHFLELTLKDKYRGL